MSGELPEGWRWAKLGEMCDVNPRRPRDLRISPQDQVTFIPMRAVSGEMAEVVSAETRRYEDVARGYTYMEEGDVIFAKITPCMQNGKHAIVHDTLTGVAFGSTEFHVLRAKEEVDPRLIHRFLLRPEFLREAEQNFTGTAGQRRVPKEFLSESPFPVAPLDEQRRIVARLEKQIAAASRAREAAAAQLVAIEGIPAALLREIFPPSPAARLPRGWRWVKLGDVCENLDSMRRPVAKSRRSPGPFPYYGASGVVDYIDAYLFDEPLVLVGEDGAKWSSGQPTAFSVSGQTWVNNHAHVLRPDRTVIVDAWVIASLTDADIQPFVTGLTVPKLNQANLRSIAIPLPPISEQRRIVSHLGAQMQATERLRDAAREKLAAVEAVSAALLREAFAL